MEGGKHDLVNSTLDALAKHVNDASKTALECFSSFSLTSFIRSLLTLPLQYSLKMISKATATGQGAPQRRGSTRAKHDLSNSPLVCLHSVFKPNTLLSLGVLTTVTAHQGSMQNTRHLKVWTCPGCFDLEARTEVHWG